MKGKTGGLLALLWLLVLLAGCKQPLPPEDNLIVVGISQVGAESDWRVANSESMKAVFTEENGYRLLFEDAKQKQENQISAIRKFIQQQVDYIILMPISEVGWDSVLQEAKAAKIPVILVDRMVNVADESLFAAHIGSDFLWEGEQAAAWMAALDKERLSIVHIQGTLGSTAQLGRTAALEAAVEAHPEWTLLAQLNGDFTQAKTYEVMREYLSSQPGKLDVVYCENDNEAFGALQALEEAGYVCGPEGVSIICFDATRQGLSFCLEGKIALAVECDPLLGEVAHQVIQTLEAGGEPNKYYAMEEEVFTSAALTQEIIDNRLY